jgi:hypothetical protein
MLKWLSVRYNDEAVPVELRSDKFVKDVTRPDLQLLSSFHLAVRSEFHSSSFDLSCSTRVIPKALYRWGLAALGWIERVILPLLAIASAHLNEFTVSSEPSDGLCG